MQLPVSGPVVSNTSPPEVRYDIRIPIGILYIRSTSSRAPPSRRAFLNIDETPNKGSERPGPGPSPKVMRPPLTPTPGPSSRPTVGQKPLGRNQSMLRPPAHAQGSATSERRGSVGMPTGQGWSRTGPHEILDPGHAKPSTQ